MEPLLAFGHMGCGSRIRKSATGGRVKARIVAELVRCGNSCDAVKERRSYSCCSFDDSGKSLLLYRRSGS